jgi:transposase
MRHTLIDERTQWIQRIQATLFHHGVSGTPERLRTGEGGQFLERLPLAADARERIVIALAIVDAIDAQIAPLERELRRLARRQAGCRALMGLYGMGEFPSLITLCELGDVQRLSSSRDARFTCCANSAPPRSIPSRRPDRRLTPSRPRSRLQFRQAVVPPAATSATAPASRG